MSCNDNENSISVDTSAKDVDARAVADEPNQPAAQSDQLLTSSNQGDSTKEDTGQGKKSEDKRSLWENLHDKTYRRKFFHTCSLFMAFAALGAAVGQRGPSFLDLQFITKTTTETASAFFTAGSVGYLLGSLVCGILYDRLNEQLMLFLSIIGLGVTVWVIPLCSPYVLMIAMFFLSAIFSGAVDTGGNAELMRVWGSDGRAYMQALHFSFALGAVISPLFTEPFLAQGLSANTSVLNNSMVTTPAISQHDFDVTGHLLESNMTTSSDGINSTSQKGNVSDIGPPVVIETRVFYAYTITGIFTLLSSIPFAVAFCQKRTLRKTVGKVDEKAEKVAFPRLQFLTALILLDLYYVLYCASEDSFGAFLAMFVVKELGWSKSMGSIITAVFYGTFAASRFLGIFFTNCIRPLYFLALCSGLLILAFVVLLISSIYAFEVGVWLSAGVAGASMSIIFPTGFLWAEEELFKVTGKISASILISASAGTMVSPPILGYLMDNYTHMWFVYLQVFMSVSCLAVFFVLVVYARKVLKKFKKDRDPSKCLEINVDGDSKQLQEAEAPFLSES